MCLGIPMRIVALDGNVATCTGRNGLQKIDATLVAPVAVGDWLLTWLGHARARIDADEAARVDLALDALAAVERGETNLEAFFPDLVGREPELPPHLRKPKADA